MGVLNENIKLTFDGIDGGYDRLSHSVSIVLLQSHNVVGRIDDH